MLPSPIKLKTANRAKRGQTTVFGFCAHSDVGFRACGAPHFLLLRQKKVRKEKATRRQRPAAQGSLRYSVFAGAPREHFFPMLRIAQGAAELGAAPLKQSSPFISPNLRCSASHNGPGKASRHNLRIDELLCLVSPCCWGCLSTGRFSPSRRQRRATEALADKGRGLSEGVARVPQTPPTTSSAGNSAQQGADAGSPSFCLLFLGEARKSKARLKREK